MAEIYLWEEVVFKLFIFNSFQISLFLFSFILLSLKLPFIPSIIFILAIFLAGENIAMKIIKKQINKTTSESLGENSIYLYFSSSSTILWIPRLRRLIPPYPKTCPKTIVEAKFLIHLLKAIYKFDNLLNQWTCTLKFLLSFLDPKL